MLPEGAALAAQCMRQSGATMGRWEVAVAALVAAEQPGGGGHTDIDERAATSRE